MDLKTRDKLSAVLASYFNATKVSNLCWPAKINDPREALEYLESSDEISLNNIWNNINTNLADHRSKDAKNATISRIAALKADAIFQELIQKRNIEDDNDLQEKFKEALKLVDQAIVYCPVSPTSLLAKKFTLRAKLLRWSDRPELALSAIKRARFLTPSSETILEELLLIKEICGQAESSNDSSSMSSSSSSSLPSTSSFSESNEQVLQTTMAKMPQNFILDSRVQMSGTPGVGKGRSFAATRTIPAKTTILLEKAYSLTIWPKSATVLCAFCYDNVANRFVPCKGCTTAVYCSAACARAHNSPHSGGHQFSCGLSKLVSGRNKDIDIIFNIFNRVGVQTVLKVIEESQEWKQSQFGGDKEVGQIGYDVFAYSSDPHQRSPAVEVANNEKLRGQQFQAQMTLYSHSEKHKMKDFGGDMINAIECAIITCIAQGFNFKQMYKEDQLLKLIAHCFVAIRRIRTNSFAWDTSCKRDKDDDRASCYFIISSMFNHSCSPNAYWSIDSGVISITTKSEVKAGEELTITYGLLLGDEFEMRQRSLRRFHFMCRCSRCIDDYQKELPALKCFFCAGPVLNTRCLLCSKKMLDAKEIQSSLKKLLEQTETLVTRVTSRNDGYRSLLNSVKVISKLIYSPKQEKWLLVSLCEVGKVLFKMGKLQECLEFGEQADCLMTRETNDLMANFNDSQEDSRNADGETTALEASYDHLAFWVSVYRLWIAQHGSTDEKLWGIMLRFNARFKEIAKSILATKKARLTDLEQKGNQKEWDALEKEICIHEQFDLRHQKQLASLKAKLAHKLDFDELIIELLAI